MGGGGGGTGLGGTAPSRLGGTAPCRLGRGGGGLLPFSILAAKIFQRAVIWYKFTTFIFGSQTSKKFLKAPLAPIYLNLTECALQKCNFLFKIFLKFPKKFV